MDRSTHATLMKNKSLACVLGLSCVLLAGCLTIVPNRTANQ
ncbi:hypothetical protein ABH944_004084 [Caballeronia udeis]|uniref:Lipoprotein n=1 Tax=Caballeronia udeis TaxID=1232866 RepID=A0ABW8MPC7_9BURK